MSTNSTERMSGGTANGDMPTETIHLSDTESVPLAVVTVASSLKDTEQTELNPLGEEIDTDALEQLFTPTNNSMTPKGYLEFPYEGCLISIDSDGLVSATLLDQK